jgi:predicted nuclease of predicted toxin-antitoxin system
MIYWIDAQLPPQLADWLSQTFNVEAYALRDLQLRDAEDEQIFQRARQQGIVIISKDSDFVEMVLRLGAPPQLLWVTCGNVTNRRLQNILIQVFPRAQELLVKGEAVVEITDLETTKTS